MGDSEHISHMGCSWALIGSVFYHVYVTDKIINNKITWYANVEILIVVWIWDCGEHILSYCVIWWLMFHPYLCFTKKFLSAIWDRALCYQVLIVNGSIFISITKNWFQNGNNYTVQIKLPMLFSKWKHPISFSGFCTDISEDTFQKCLLSIWC